MEKNRQLKIALPTRSDRLPTIFVQHQTELPSGGWLLQRPLTPSSLVGLRQLLGLYEDSGPLVFLTMARLNQKKYTTNGLPLRTYNIYVFFHVKVIELFPTKRILQPLNQVIQAVTELDPRNRWRSPVAIERVTPKSPVKKGKIQYQPQLVIPGFLNKLSSSTVWSN